MATYHLDDLDPALIFQVWDYTPSLSRLLLRARQPRSTLGRPPMIDVIFAGVRYMSIPTTLHLWFVAPTDAEQQRYQSYDLAVNRLFVIENQPARHVIVACACTIHAHHGDLFASPLDAQSL